MTLIVADLFDGDQIALVADTLVTWDPGERESRAGTEELAKLVILRNDLAVGIAGEDPHGRLRDLDEYRNADLPDLLGMLEEDPVAGFLVAHLNPLSIWSVREGVAIEKTSIGHAWDGDQLSYEDEYRPKFDKEFPGASIPFRQMTAMQWITSFRRSPVVGGRALRVVGTPNGFRFLADRQTIFGGEASIIFAGGDRTPGALGIYYPQLGVGGLFRQDAPDLAVEVRATNSQDFSRRSLDEFDQDVFPAHFA